LLSRGDPTNPLVTRERGDVGPKVRGYGIKLDGPLEIWRHLHPQKTQTLKSQKSYEHTT